MAMSDFGFQSRTTHDHLFFGEITDIRGLFGSVAGIGGRRDGQQCDFGIIAML